MVEGECLLVLYMRVFVSSVMLPKGGLTMCL